MFKPDKMSPREDATVHNARMVDLVGDDDVVTAEESGDRSGIGTVARRKSDGILGFLKRRDLLFELHMDAGGSRQEPDPMSAGPKFFDGFFSGGIDLGVPQEIKIGIRRKLKQRPAVDRDMNSVHSIRRMHVRIEVMFFGFLDPLVQDLDSGQKCFFGRVCGFCHGFIPLLEKAGCRALYRTWGLR